MNQEKTSGLLAGSLITSIVGGILFLLLDFAGWYNYNLSVESWGWVGFDAVLENADPIGLALYLLIFFGFLYCAVASLGAFVEIPLMNNFFTVKRGFIVALVISIVIIAAGIYFIVVMLEDEPSDWWLDSGFYGGVIGSGLTALLFYLVIRQSTPDSRSE